MTQTTNLIQSAFSTPVSVSDLKMQLQLFGDSSYDLELATLLLTATDYVSKHIGKQISSSKFELNIPSFNINTFDTKNVDIISVKYYDEDNTLQTLDKAQYLVDSTSVHARILFSMPPIISKDFQNPICIQYYSEMKVVPQVIRHAILMVAAELFEVRTESTDAKARKAAITVDRLLASERRVEL
ncbi:head-tail connector protein [Pseudorhodobacter turbinis]|nr:hypothetical protein [Pseudorhodobacter turbinis]